MLRKLLQSLKVRSKPKKPGNSFESLKPIESKGPKNGRLFLATLGSFALLIVLINVTIKVAKDPAIANRSFKPCLSFYSKPDTDASSAAGKVGANNQTCPAPPAMTFYKDLQAEPAPIATPAPVTESVIPGEERKGSIPEAAAKEKPVDRKPKISTQSSQEASAPQQRSVKNNEKGAKSYTVQVGAFAQPSIAQEWAQKWKARGYDVLLKPVARPKTGVSYSLYLGNFVSEKEADDLVKHLKAKEGITALRLVVK